MHKANHAKPEILIIGGGVISLLTARELVLAGCRVSIYERGRIGLESSWAGGGILSPLQPWSMPAAITRLCRWSQNAYPDLAAELAADTGVDPEWTQSGMIFCNPDDSAKALRWCEAEHIPHSRLDAKALHALEPGLRCAPRHPFFLPEIAQIRNPRLLRALSADLTKRGVKIIENEPVKSLVMADGRVTGVETASGSAQADCFVVAAGAWSNLPELADIPQPDVFPVKGQMVLFRAEPGALEHIVLSENHYLIPRRDGLIIAGSTIEFTGFDKSTSQPALEELTEFALSHLPSLDETGIETQWAGLRPGSTTGVPRIGCHPHLGNLYFNCGHFRNGFVMAPASAHLLADLILGRTPIVPPDPYAIQEKRQRPIAAA